MGRRGGRRGGKFRVISKNSKFSREDQEEGAALLKRIFANSRKTIQKV